MAPQIIATGTATSSFSSPISISTPTQTTSQSLATNSLSPSPPLELSATPTFLSFEGTYPQPQDYPNDGRGRDVRQENLELFEFATLESEVTTVPTPYVGVLPSFASEYRPPATTSRTYGKSDPATARVSLVFIAIVASFGVLIILAVGAFLLRQRLIRRRRSPFETSSQGDKGEENAETGTIEGCVDTHSSVKGDASSARDPNRLEAHTSFSQDEKHNSSPVFYTPRSFSMPRLPRVESIRIIQRPPPIVVLQAPVSQQVIVVQDGTDSPRLPREIIRRQCDAQRLGLSPSASPVPSSPTSSLPSPNPSLISFSSILPESGLSRSLTSPLLPPSSPPIPAGADSPVSSATSTTWLGGDVTAEPGQVVTAVRLPESYSWDFRCRGLVEDDDDEAKYGIITSIDLKTINSTVPVIQVIPAIESSNALAARENNAPPVQSGGISGKETLTTKYTSKSTGIADSPSGLLDEVLSKAMRQNKLLDDISATLAARLSRDLGNSTDTTIHEPVHRSACSCDADDADSSFLNDELGIACGSPSWIGQPSDIVASDASRVVEVAEVETRTDLVVTSCNLPSVQSESISLEIPEGVRSLIVTSSESTNQTEVEKCTRSDSNSEPSTPISSRRHESDTVRETLKSDQSSPESLSLENESVKGKTEQGQVHEDELDSTSVESNDPLESYVAMMEIANKSRPDVMVTPKKEVIPRPSRIPVPTSPRPSSSRVAKRKPTLESDELFSTNSSLSNITGSLSMSFVTPSGPRTPLLSCRSEVVSPSPSRFYNSKGIFPRKSPSSGSLISSTSTKVQVRSPPSKIAVWASSPSLPSLLAVSESGLLRKNDKGRTGKLTPDKYAAFVADSGSEPAWKPKAAKSRRTPLADVRNLTSQQPTTPTPKRVATAVTTSPKPAWR